MKKIFLLLLPLLMGATIAEPPVLKDQPVELQQYLDDIYGQLKTTTATGIKLPSGAVFFMVSGNCPTGTTDVSATYANKFIRVNSTQASTGGSDTVTLQEVNLPSHSHSAGTLVTASDGAHTHTIQTVIAGTQSETNFLKQNQEPTTDGATDSAGAHTHTISGSTGTVGSGTAVTITNPYVTCKLCQVD